MIRTVIAEDELALLRGIKTLIEKLDGDFEVVCCARNGREALEYLSQHEADVLFTDVQMPVLGGLELMRQAHAFNPHMQLVVISGYHEFDYARQAMAYGAKRYLTKPLDRQELVALLQSLKEGLEIHAHTQKREALLSCLFGMRPQEMETCTWGRLTALAICVGTYQSEQTDEELAKPGALSVNANDALCEKLHCKALWQFYGYRPNEAVWVLEDADEPSAEAMLAVIHAQMAGDACVTLAVGTPVGADELAKQVRELEAWLRDGALFARESAYREKPPVGERLFSSTDRISWKIAARRRQDFAAALQGQRALLRAKRVTQQELERLLTAIIECVVDDSQTQADARAAAHALVAACGSLDTLFDELDVYCADLLEGRGFDTADKLSLMQSVEAYILENVASPLSLKELSLRFGLVAPYLSKLFKAYKGMSPAQYVQHIRIECAKRMLLDNPTMLSKDIAEALGYSNPLYFSKTFRKNVGMYPSEYRMQAER